MLPKISKLANGVASTAIGFLEACPAIIEMVRRTDYWLSGKHQVLESDLFVVMIQGVCDEDFVVSIHAYYCCTGLAVLLAMAS